MCAKVIKLSIRMKEHEFVGKVRMAYGRIVHRKKKFGVGVEEI